MNIKKFLVGVSSAFVGMFLLAGSVLASSTFFGEASVVSPGSSSNNAAELVSDASPGFGEVSFSVPAGVSTLADLATLSTDFNVTDDDCGGGSPRFQVRIDFDSNGVVSAGDKNIFVYLGPSPNYTGCTPNTWESSGNLVTDSDPVWDTSQVGGTFYDTYANAVALTAELGVLRISLVVDSNWMFGDGEQTVRVDNVMANSDLYTFEPPVPTSKDECKKGGWMNMANDEGNPFKNQGDCVSFVASGGKALGNP